MATIETDHDAGRSDGHDPVPGIVDWTLGVLAGLIGLLAGAAGVWLYTDVDRAAITDILTDESVEVNGITTQEAITAAEPLLDWVAVGLAGTGAVLVIGAVGFVYARRRTRRRVARRGGSTATFWAAAVYGAAVATLVSFVPGSTAVGGGTAAYLHDDDHVRVGTAASLVSVGLLAPLLVFGSVGLFAGAEAIGEASGGVVLATVIVGSQVIGVAIGAGLGALGGFLVGRYAGGADDTA